MPLASSIMMFAPGPSAAFPMGSSTASRFMQPKLGPSISVHNRSFPNSLTITQTLSFTNLHLYISTRSVFVNDFSQGRGSLGAWAVRRRVL